MYPDPRNLSLYVVLWQCGGLGGGLLRHVLPADVELFPGLALSDNALFMGIVDDFRLNLLPLIVEQYRIVFFYPGVGVVDGLAFPRRLLFHRGGRLPPGGHLVRAKPAHLLECLPAAPNGDFFLDEAGCIESLQHPFPRYWNH